MSVTCEVLKPVLNTNPTHPLSGAFSPLPLLGGEFCTTMVPPNTTCNLPSLSISRTPS